MALRTFRRFGRSEQFRVGWGGRKSLPYNLNYNMIIHVSFQGRLTKKYKIVNVRLDIIPNPTRQLQADGVAVFAQSGTDSSTVHTRLTLELLDTIVKNLDAHPASIVAYLNEVGQCHRFLKSEGVSVAMWDDLGEFSGPKKSRFIDEETFYGLGHIFLIVASG